MALAPMELVQCGRSLNRGPSARARPCAHLLDSTGLYVVGFDHCPRGRSIRKRALRLARDDADDSVSIVQTAEGRRKEVANSRSLVPAAFRRCNGT